jgi:peptidoglycan/xylan/chitin deacetylase (PgdA/CDA1 family)
MRKFTTILFFVLLIFTVFNLGLAEEDYLDDYLMSRNFNNSIFVLINDELISFDDVLPEVSSGITYVPIRRFAESMGAIVSWNGELNQVRIDKNGKSVVLDNSSDILFTSDDQKVEMSFMRKGNSILAPYRFIGEYFGYTVSYFSEGPIARVKDGSAEIPDSSIAEEFREEILKQKREQLLSSSANARVTYLTFDDGPNSHTITILDLLKKYDMKATFFMLNNNIRAYPNTVRRMINEGHAVGLHGVTHDVNKVYKSATSVLEEMNTTNNTLYKAVGQRSKLIRVPYGSHPHLTREQYNHLVNAGYKMWDWSIDSGDSRAGASSTRVRNHMINSLSNVTNNSSVVVMHDKKLTLDALEDIFIWMKLNGITSKAITEDMTPHNWK